MSKNTGLRLSEYPISKWDLQVFSLRLCFKMVAARRSAERILTQGLNAKAQRG
jgi:hypothetical protein